MSRLSYAQQLNELDISRKFLEDLIQKPVKSFCYPYGRKNSYNTKTLELLLKTNYKNAISVESRDISKNDISEKVYELPRYDCNEVKQIFSIK